MNHAVEIFHDCTPDLFRTRIEPRREPAVMRGLPLGPCTNSWRSPELFGRQLRPRTVRVHVTREPNMSFAAKNFQYCDMDMRELVNRAQDDSVKENGELYYLRSVNAEGRTIQISRLHTDFPELAEDFCLPALFEPDRFFSSVLRISSGGVRVWTHYDVMDNVYCQILGHKTAVLWPPHEASRLYIDG